MDFYNILLAKKLAEKGNDDSGGGGLADDLFFVIEITTNADDSCDCEYKDYDDLTQALNDNEDKILILKEIFSDGYVQRHFAELDGRVIGYRNTSYNDTDISVQFRGYSFPSSGSGDSIEPYAYGWAWNVTTFDPND